MEDPRRYEPEIRVSFIFEGVEMTVSARLQPELLRLAVPPDSESSEVIGEACSQAIPELAGQLARQCLEAQAQVSQAIETAAGRVSARMVQKYVDLVQDASEARAARADQSEKSSEFPL